MRTRLLAVLFVAALALAGCTSDNDSPNEARNNQQTNTHQAETDTSAPATTDEPAPGAPSTGPSQTGAAIPGDESAAPNKPFPANTAPDTQAPSIDAALTVTGIRTARHDQYDRVVFELGGTGTPGWTVEYVPQPIEDGSGTRLNVDGDSYLQVMITGSAYPTDSGIPEYSGPNPIDNDQLEEIDEVQLSGIFEGVTQAFIGVDDQPAPFRVFALTNPTRVVVDVQWAPN